MELRETEVDGVPVVWSRVPGPLRAGLLFRVGLRTSAWSSMA